MRYKDKNKGLIIWYEDQDNWEEDQKKRKRSSRRLDAIAIAMTALVIASLVWFTYWWFMG